MKYIKLTKHINLHSGCGVKGLAGGTLVCWFQPYGAVGTVPGVCAPLMVLKIL